MDEGEKLCGAGTIENGKGKVGLYCNIETATRLSAYVVANSRPPN